MILVDDRVGSVELASRIPTLTQIPTTVIRMEYADFAFCGEGPKGPVTIGVERKRLTDALSSMSTGRYTGQQLPGLLSEYDYCVLIIEGVWRADKDTGVLVTLRGREWVPARVGPQTFLYSELDNWLTSLQTQTPVSVKHTQDPDSTCTGLANLYHWWNKPWATHRALNPVYIPRPSTAILTPPSFARRVAYLLDGIAWEMSKDVAERFGSVADMCKADEAAWRNIKGIGPTIAKNAVDALHGLSRPKKKFPN